MLQCAFHDNSVLNPYAMANADDDLPSYPRIRAPSDKPYKVSMYVTLSIL